MILLDTNVLIEILKNNQDSIQQILLLKPPLAISSITAMELIYGARNKSEVLKLEKFIEKFDIIHLDEQISALAYQFITEFSKSHNLDIPDALIAAAAIQNRAQFLTYNKKIFRFIPAIKLI